MKKYFLSFVVIASTVVVFYGQTNSGENAEPPSLSIGSQLYKGQISSGGMLKFNDSEKEVSDAMNRDSDDNVVTKAGINFYHVGKDLILGDLLDNSKCINANVDSLIFFIYSPGGEVGMEQKGFYLYPPDLADGNINFGITDKSQFIIGKGRVFGLYTANEAVSSCFMDAYTVSSVDLTDIVKEAQPGWLQIPVKSLKLSETLTPFKNCIKSIWIQDGATNFSEIAISEIDGYSLKSFVILWLETGDCKEKPVPVEVPLPVPAETPPEVPAEASPAEDPPALTTFNVKDAPFLAKGDGVTDDGPAIQKALDKASSSELGGKVFIPEGTYFIDTTLMVDDNTEVYGEREKSVLMRGNRYVLRPSYEDLNSPTVDEDTGYTFETDTDTSCKSTESLTYTVSKELFSNRHYNCGNKNIHFHDFAVDGSKIVVSQEPKIQNYKLDGTLGYVGVNPKQNMGTFSLSGMENLVIENLKIKNTPQDAIFIRNGGVNTIIRNNFIDGFNMLWHNGGGINIEVHPNGHFHVTTDRPVIIENNHIIARGPNFCYGDGHAQCTSDAQCSDHSFVGTTKTETTPDTSLFCKPGATCPGVCGTVQPSRFSNVAGIATGTRDLGYGKFPFITSSIIKNNVIELSNRHFGINCKDCKNSIIENNTLKPYGGAESFGLFGGSFTGITVNGNTENIVVNDNIVNATGKPGEGRALWLSGKSNLVAKRNKISGRNTGDGKNLGTTGVAHVSGFDGLVFSDNEMTEIQNSVILEVGACWGATKNGEFKGNILNGVPNTYVPLYTKKLIDVKFSFIENIFSKTVGPLFYDNSACAADTPPSFNPSRQYYKIEVKDSDFTPKSITLKNGALTTIDVQKTDGGVAVFNQNDFEVTESAYPPPPEGYQRFVFTPDREGKFPFSINGSESGNIVVIE